MKILRKNQVKNAIFYLIAFLTKKIEKKLRHTFILGVLRSRVSHEIAC